MAVTAQAFDLRQILISMTKINWEVKDVMSQHNSYIDVILRVNRRHKHENITYLDLIIVIRKVVYTTLKKNEIKILSGNTNLHIETGTNQN